MCKLNKGYVEIDGAKLYYEVAGGGDPLLLLHAGIAVVSHRIADN